MAIPSALIHFVNVDRNHRASFWKGSAIVARMMSAWSWKYEVSLSGGGQDGLNDRKGEAFICFAWLNPYNRPEDQSSPSNSSSVRFEMSGA